MAAIQPWGRAAAFGLGLAALLAGQLVALLALTWWYDVDVARLPDFSGDGVAVTVVILASTPVQVVVLAIFSWIKGASSIDYLGLIWPRRSEIVVGIASVAGLIVIGDALSLVLDRNIITPFQSDIYRTAAAAGWLPLLWFAVVVLTPIGEETLFRGFLFRSWLRAPHDTWPVIAVTALLWALIHVQYDWYVIGQVFVSGLLLGWLRWVSGSTILAIMMHGLINFEGLMETLVLARSSV